LWIIIEFYSEKQIVAFIQLIKSHITLANHSVNFNSFAGDTFTAAFGLETGVAATDGAATGFGAAGAAGAGDSATVSVIRSLNLPMVTT
jgi:hypothetical protein